MPILLILKLLEEILSSHKKKTTTSIETSLLMLLLLLRNKGVDVVAFVVGLQFTHCVVCCGTLVQFLRPAIERLLHLASLLESLELLVGLNKIRPFNDGGGIAVLFDRIEGNLLLNQPAVFHLPFYSLQFSCTLICFPFGSVFHTSSQTSFSISSQSGTFFKCFVTWVSSTQLLEGKSLWMTW